MRAAPGTQPVDALHPMLTSAPLDDEPVTDEDRAAIRDGLEEQTSGDVVAHEEVKRLVRRSG